MARLPAGSGPLRSAVIGCGALAAPAFGVDQALGAFEHPRRLRTSAPTANSPLLDVGLQPILA